MASVIPQVIGHRGCAAVEIENSHAAFARAAAMRGVAGVELDVQLGADASILVFHDRSLERMAGDARPVASLRDADRRRVVLRAPESAGATSVTGTLPTLDEVRDLLPPDAVIDIELKSYPDARAGLARAVAEWVVDRNEAAAAHATGRQAAALQPRREAGHRLLVSSFDPRLLRRFRAELRRLGRHLPTAAIYSTDAELPRVLRRGLGTLMTGSECEKPDWRTVQRRAMRPAFRRRPARPVWVWTVNEREILDAMCRCGVEAVIGDDPERLAGWLREAGEPCA